MLDICVTEHQRIYNDYQKGIKSRAKVKHELEVLIEKCERDLGTPDLSQTTQIGLHNLIDLCEQNIVEMDGDTKEIASATGPATTP